MIFRVWRILSRTHASYDSIMYNYSFFSFENKQWYFVMYFFSYKLALAPAPNEWMIFFILLPFQAILFGRIQFLWNGHSQIVNITLIDSGNCAGDRFLILFLTYNVTTHSLRESRLVTSLNRLTADSQPAFVQFCAIQTCIPVIPGKPYCDCDPAETRTLDPLIKSQLLYQLSYEV